MTNRDAVLVTGATGNVGGALAGRLAADGLEVRALTRSGRGDGLPAGVRAIRADLEAPASVRSAATGARAAFLLPGFSEMPGVLAADLRFEAVPDAEARRELAARMPERYVDAFLRFYVDGTLDDSVVLPTVEEVTGAPARAFRQWAGANATRFA